MTVYNKFFIINLKYKAINYLLDKIKHQVLTLGVEINDNPSKLAKEFGYCNKNKFIKELTKSERSIESWGMEVEFEVGIINVRIYENSDSPYYRNQQVIF